MSDQPEPLAAILAEMRAAAKSTDLFNGEEVGEPLIRGTKVEDWAARIEAAYKRERAELLRQLRNEIEINNALATVRPQFHYVDDVIAEAAKERAHETELAKLRATGNAAAMREALENARSKFIHIKKCADEGEVSRKKLTILCEFVSQEIAAALAAPARNCDRFKTFDEARKAFQDLRGHKILADVELWDSMDEAGALVRWLFATAKEGGDHA